MKILIKVLALYCFSLLVYEIQADELDPSKLDHPYMAILYYPDETVTHQGSRFFQTAILIKVDRMISASIEIGNDTYPVKTLVARTGVITIDSNFTFNEDEDEQESEIIEIIQPFKYSSKDKWSTDISIVKTLMPFNTSVYVKPISIDFSGMDESGEKSCKILAFVKKTSPAWRKLVIIGMELTTECGPKFESDTMVCGIEESKNYTRSDDFCLDNSGGPLICSEKIVGIQNYLEGEACQPPRLFQLLSGWSKFINCGLIDCREECQETCKIIPKDEPKETSGIAATEETYGIKVDKPIMFQTADSKEEVVFRSNDGPVPILDEKTVNEKYKEFNEETSKVTTQSTEETTTATETTTTYVEATEVTAPATTTFSSVNVTVANLTSLRKDSRKMGGKNSANINSVAHLILSPVILKFLI